MLSAKTITQFFKQYKVGVYYIDKFEEEDQDDLPSDYDNAIDMRGTPTHVCVCGCNVWKILAIFENYEISTYFLEMECVKCGTWATAPTVVDRKSTRLNSSHEWISRMPSSA